MAGGGVQKIYMVFLREPSRRGRSGSDLFHLRDGFEIKMNFDRNVSCFIFVNADVYKRQAFPPLHTGHATFTASGVPSIKQFS